MINISIDTGNKQIKTLHHTFTAGINPDDVSLVNEIDYFKMNGKNYVLTNKRQPYLRDKSTSDRYLELAIMGVLKELDYMAENSELVYDKNTIYDINLLCGLPPAHLKDSALKKNYQNYFKGEFKAVYKKRVWKFNIKRVSLYSQCFAALMTIYPKLKTMPRVIGIDMGGFTADYLVMRGGKADIDMTDSLENGIIILYQKIKRACATKDYLVDEDDIDDVLLGKPSGLDKTIIQIVEKETSAFIESFLDSFREYQIDLKNYCVVFIGGAAILLKPYLQKSKLLKECIFIDEINANAKGYELLYAISTKRK